MCTTPTPEIVAGELLPCIQGRSPDYKAVLERLRRHRDHPEEVHTDSLLRVLGFFDWCVQGLLFGLAYIYPWFAPRRHRWAVVLYPLVIAFFWGIWRVLSFDALFHIDCPGIGCWATGVLLAGIGFIFHLLRCAFSRPPNVD